nr:MAG TPA: hypothetical protein [Caudoviricetes sp.]
MKSEKQLYQWDVNQHLTELQPTAQFVDYPMGNEVIRIETDGKRCRIPDEFLQTAGFKTCYERYSDGTYTAYNFNVQSSPKPPDYVYTAEERTTFDALVAKADAAIAEIKRRADSGEFTPKKGVDYFTDEEKTELMEGVSSGAVGEFRKVVDTATAEYNDNHNLQLAKYNANAAEKLTTYDTNDEQRTSDYNRNAEVKLEAYNSNHTAKVAEYNANAETKKAEFDSNAAALQTEVDRLRGECDTLATENRKQENKISALIKLNKGQTYDILPEEGETVSRTVPSGAKYVSVDKVGGKSIVWNQQVDTSNALLTTRAGVTLSRKENGKLFLSGTATGGDAWCIAGSANLVIGHKYISKRAAENVAVRIDNTETGRPAINFIGNIEVQTLTEPAGNIVYTPVREGEYVNSEIDPFIIDLTLMFGAGNEPTAEQFGAMFPAESYPYNPGEIISSRTETITAGAETITTGFPELRSAIAAHDYIDMDGEQTIRSIGKIKFNELKTKEFENGIFYILHSEIGAKLFNASCLTPGFSFIDEELVNIKPGECNGRGYYFRFKAPAEIDTVDKFIEKYGDDDIFFELATPTTEPVTIPEALQEWLPVEPGGTVTFRNADESKQLPVPNAVSWVRKLNEVN